MPGPGQQPTPEQIQMMQQKIAADAAKLGLTVPQFIEKIKAEQMAMQAQMRAQQQGQQQGGQPPQQQQAQQPQPIQPGPPTPAALAVAKFLKSQDLKPRTCILNDQRKDMFKGMSGLRSHKDVANVRLSQACPSRSAKSCVQESTVEERVPSALYPRG